MTSTRIGKIARLPLAVRDQLNSRLHEGERQQLLVDWLNALPAVQAVLAAEFAGAPITEQNLSVWKQGGYADWVRLQESRACMRNLLEESTALQADVAGDASPATLLAAPLTVALSRVLQQVTQAAPDDPAQRATLLNLVREVTRQRRCDHAEARLQREREHWAAERIQAAEKAVEDAHEHRRRHIRAREMREKFYGPERAALLFPETNSPLPASSALAPAASSTISGTASPAPPAPSSGTSSTQMTPPFADSPHSAEPQNAWEHAGPQHPPEPATEPDVGYPPHKMALYNAVLALRNALAPFKGSAPPPDAFPPPIAPSPTESDPIQDKIISAASPPPLIAC